jgi:hypothetical protein
MVVVLSQRPLVLVGRDGCRDCKKCADREKYDQKVNALSRAMSFIPFDIVMLFVFV